MHRAAVDPGGLLPSIQCKQDTWRHLQYRHSTYTYAQCCVVVVSVLVDMQDGEGEGEGEAGEGDEQGVRKKRRKRRRDKQFALDEEDYDLLEEAVSRLLFGLQGCERSVVLVCRG